VREGRPNYLHAEAGQVEVGRTRSYQPDGAQQGRREPEPQTLLARARLDKTALLDYLLESASEVRVARALGVESEMEFASAALHQFCLPTGRTSS
jgi:hypothetical protein